jgi:hypothetical protein
MRTHLDRKRAHCEERPSVFQRHARRFAGNDIDNRERKVAAAPTPGGFDLSAVPSRGSSANFNGGALRLSEPNDRSEREADRVADQFLMHLQNWRIPSHQAYPVQPGLDQDVVRTTLPADHVSRATSIEQEQEDREEREEQEENSESGSEAVQAKYLNNARPSGEDSSDFTDRLKGHNKGGAPLESEFRDGFESLTGADLSSVRVHTDSVAAEMSRSIGARAFTHGDDIYFGTRQYDPDTRDGKRLIAHEVTHVVQQRGHNKSAANPRPDVVQRQAAAAAMGAAEWIAVGAAGYDVAGDIISNTAGDISYKFDEMTGVLLPGGGSDVEAYRRAHPGARIRSHTHTVSTWISHWTGGRAMGIKFGLSFNFDGHAVGNISCRILDTYDWPAWSGTVDVNFTPLSLSSAGAAKVRITLNLNSDRTLLGGAVRSRILELDGTGTIRKLGSGAHVRFGE